LFLVDIGLPNGVRASNIRVTDGDIFGCDVLIGMDIIGAGDFSITNVNGITVMSFRLPSIKEIDYVEEANQIRLLGVVPIDVVDKGRARSPRFGLLDGLATEEGSRCPMLVRGSTNLAAGC
jgi:hypothetical protein